MSTKKKDHRNQKFRELLLNRFNNSQIKMANELDINASLVSRYANDAKGIGEDMVDHIETKLNIPGYFDSGMTLSDAQKESDDDSLLEILGLEKDVITLEFIKTVREIGKAKEEDLPELRAIFMAFLKSKEKKGGK